MFPAPQIECVYHMSNDELVQFWTTPAGAFHLPPPEDGWVRVITPDMLLRDHTIHGHCDILVNGDENDVPLSMEQMMAFHFGYVQREAKQPPPSRR